MRYFIDMDGTLAVYPSDKDDWWLKPGIFKDMEPQEKVVKAIKRLINNGQDVYILSAYNENVPDTVVEKDYWLDKHIPEIDYEHRIYTVVGKEKTDYVPEGLQPTDVLLDDYNNNLENWVEHGGIGIKLLNGINSKRSWDGVSVRAKGTIKGIVECLVEIDDILEEREQEKEKRCPRREEMEL